VNQAGSILKTAYLRTERDGNTVIPVAQVGESRSNSCPSKSSRPHLKNKLKLSTHGSHSWLTPVIPATQEAEIRRITIQSQPGQIVLEILSRKTHPKTRLVEWLSGRVPARKQETLSSNCSTAKK
jgi:hypothetical protein